MLTRATLSELMVAGSGEWVQWTHAETGRPYFYNRVTGTTTSEPPDGPPVVWIGQLSPDGKPYYWHRESLETVWELPPLSPRDAPASVPRSARAGPDDGARRAPAPGAAAGGCDAEAWVEVFPGTSGCCYYWNCRDNVTADALPVGARATWSAHRTPEGDFYYCRAAHLAEGAQEASWEIPGRRVAEASQEVKEYLAAPSGNWLDYGAGVAIKGLTRDFARFNGQVGNVLDCDGRCVHLRLPELLGATALAIPPDRLVPLPSGSLVSLTGLSQSGELNDQSGTVESFNRGTRRYVVKLRDGSMKSVRPDKVRARSRLWEIPTSVSESDELRWRAEQKCLFIDSQGFHRHYSLHLPAGFEQRVEGVESGGLAAEPRKWPLLVYLHGKGGGTFFTRSKKSLTTPGTQFAAREFVVISPECQWTWRDTPSDWCLELIRAMVPADWIDHRRVYLTGCSMGGMGAWELGAAEPELFAAVAPVAGYHKAEKRPWMLSRLRDKPMMVIHSEVDDTCPKRLEEPLWSNFSTCERFQLVIVPHADHCNIHDDAYGKTDLFQWLLKHTVD